MTSLWISLIFLIVASLFTLSFVRQTWLIPMIALLWAGWSLGVLPNYLGYSIDAQLVGDRQAVVLNVSKTQDYLYVTVIFNGDAQPRLVVMPNTTDNDKATEKTSPNGGPSIIQFNGSRQVSHVDLNNSDQFKK